GSARPRAGGGSRRAPPRPPLPPPATARPAPPIPRPSSGRRRAPAGSTAREAAAAGAPLRSWAPPTPSDGRTCSEASISGRPVRPEERADLPHRERDLLLRVLPRKEGQLGVRG